MGSLDVKSRKGNDGARLWFLLNQENQGRGADTDCPLWPRTGQGVRKMSLLDSG